MIILPTLVAVLIYCIGNRIQIRGAEIVGETPPRHSGPDLHGCESTPVAFDRWPSPLQLVPRITHPQFPRGSSRSSYDGRGSPLPLRAERLAIPTRLKARQSQWVSSCAVDDRAGRKASREHIISWADCARTNRVNRPAVLCFAARPPSGRALAEQTLAASHEVGSSRSTGLIAVTKPSVPSPDSAHPPLANSRSVRHSKLHSG